MIKIHHRYAHVLCAALMLLSMSIIVSFMLTALHVGFGEAFLTR